MIQPVEFSLPCSPMPDSSPFSSPVREALADANPAPQKIYSDRLKKLIVYGSHAGGEARPKSDVDRTDPRWIGVIVLKGKVHPDEKARRTYRLVIRPASEHGVASPFFLPPAESIAELFERVENPLGLCPSLGANTHPVLKLLVGGQEHSEEIVGPGPKIVLRLMPPSG